VQEGYRGDLAEAADVRDDGRQEVEEENQNNKEGDFGLIHDSSVRENVAEASWTAALSFWSSHRERTLAWRLPRRPMQSQRIRDRQEAFLMSSSRSSVLCRRLARPGMSLCRSRQWCSCCQAGKASIRLPDRASSLPSISPSFPGRASPPSGFSG